MTTKYHVLQPFLGEILDAIRKDIKTDYLPGSTQFYKTYFGNRPLNRLTRDEINAAFIKELLLGNVDLSEWVINRWVFKHGDIYQHFAMRLLSIHVDMDAITSLSLEQSRSVLAGAKESFGSKLLYFFSVLNSVVFPEEILAELRSEAEMACAQEQEEGLSAKEELSRAQLIERQERAESRLIDKYERKIAGVLKKYELDIAALKAQVRALQKK